MSTVKAPGLEVAEWLNTRSPVTLDALRGRVVVIEAFQLLCPGCVLHGLPQAQRVAQTFARDDVVVLGLHSVFEHHAAQDRRDVLEAFLHENRITFPVGMDAAGAGDIPRTMAAYELRGTPTTILIDRRGHLAGSHFGRVDDMALGARIMALVNGSAEPGAGESTGTAAGGRHACADTGCAVSGGQPQDTAPT